MQYVRLGKSGLQVSRICLGMMSYGTPEWRDWILTEEQSRPFVRMAVEGGINFFDTADMYSMGVSEEVTGRLIKEFFPIREDYVIATKVFFNFGAGSGTPNRGGLSRKHIMDAIDASLKRLKLDYVDLYQIHRYDPQTPIEETMEALHDVVKAGKARYIGASSMWTWQFVQMQHTAEIHGWTKFVSMQNHYNLVYREEEREMNPYCLATGVGTIPWSPLARGFLAGNRTREEGVKAGETARAKSDNIAQNFYYNDADFDIVDRVKELAQRHAKTNSQIALAWMLHKSAVTAPIVGATKEYQLKEAIESTEIVLSAEEIAFLEELYQPRAISGHA
jgi:1-deoxyxylulose-5-phosphate synthase